jgi:hypothetical protein
LGVLVSVEFTTGVTLGQDAPTLDRCWCADGAWTARGELAFEDPPQSELRLNTSSYEGQSGGWRDYPSFTRLRTPGCYAYQIDTSAGTWSIVFTANGPAV